MIKVFLPEDLENIVRQEANAEHISPGAYIGTLVKEALEGKTLNDDIDDEEVFEDDGPVDRSNRICVNLYGKDANQLKLKARSNGLTPTAYIRKVAYTQEIVNIIVPTDDIREFIDEFKSLERAFTSAVGYIKRSEGDVFIQDIELLKDYMSQIGDLFEKQVRISYSQRFKVENKMMKYVKAELKRLKK